MMVERVLVLEQAAVDLFSVFTLPTIGQIR
jgi:S-methylmethionine-dependent homocysteine/selenocysteine methylase